MSTSEPESARYTYADAGVSIAAGNGAVNAPLQALLHGHLEHRHGAAAGLERWTAVVSIVQQTPRTDERLRRNPLGIYVNGLSWSRELDSSEGVKP